MTKETKKKFIWAFISVLIAGLCIWMVLRGAKGMSLELLRSKIANSNPFLMLASALCMFGFIFFEALSIHALLKGSSGYNKRKRYCITYSAADVFVSAITPSASGGQPAAAFFMMLDGIPGTVSTVVLIINLVMYTLAVVVAGLVALLIAPGQILIFSSVSKLLILVGISITLGLMLLFWLILKKGDIIFNFGIRAVDFMHDKLHMKHLIKHPEVKKAKIEKTREDYKQCARLMTGKKKELILSLLYNIGSRFSLTTVTPLIYVATTGDWAHFNNLWATQCLVAIGSNCAPIPGAMGVADALMLDGLSSIMDEEATFSLELLSRSMSFYLCVLLAGTIMGIGFFIRRRKK